jgi:hypothetical protein
MRIQRARKKEASKSRTSPRTIQPNTAGLLTPSHPAQRLQLKLGNRAAGHLIQAKLGASQAENQQEQVADRLAEHVMRMPDAVSPTIEPVSTGADTPRIQRLCSECEDDLQRQPRDEEEMRLQAKEAPNSARVFDPGVGSLGGGGQPLPLPVRAFFEPRFGHDFSEVRIHTGEEAEQSARAINALAYTVGRDIVFGANHYAPETEHGQRLLAHELAHVVQQSSQASAGPGRMVQRMKYGSGTPPEMDGRTVLIAPAEERPLVDEAIDRIRAVADDPNTFSNCHQFFAEECDGGPDTLKKTFDAAKLWKWPPQFPASGGAIANTPGENIAYTRYAYNKGVDWLAAALVHELLHNCGGGAEPLTPHRRADLARIYCMGPGKNEITLKAGVDLDKSWSLLFSYRRLIHEWAGGKLTLNVGSDINIFGLLRQADPVDREKVATELGSGTLGIRKRLNLWGAERYGGLLLSGDLGFGVDRFKVRAANASDRPDIVTGAGVVLQLGTRIEFWVPSVEFKEGRVSAFSFETAYRLVQPLTPGAERIHEFVFGIGGSF